MSWAVVVCAIVFACKCPENGVGGLLAVLLPSHLYFVDVYHATPSFYSYHGCGSLMYVGTWYGHEHRVRNSLAWHRPVDAVMFVFFFSTISVQSLDRLSSLLTLVMMRLSFLRALKLKASSVRGVPKSGFAIIGPRDDEVASSNQSSPE